MVDFSSVALGGVIGSLLTGSGWILKRLISGEKARERATLYSSYASIASTMKAQGLASEDVEAVAALISKKKTRDIASQVPPSMVSPEADMMGDNPTYWTQGAMNVRAAAAARIAQKQLDAVLTELSTLLPQEEFQAFEKSQEAWERLRETQVNFEAQQVAGGSMEPLIRHSEEEAVTLKRLAEVNAMIERRKEADGL